MIQTIQRVIQKPIATPFILLLVCILAYGLYLPWMGFYWDDWPWIWYYHVDGLEAIRGIDAAFRPLAGVLLWTGAQVAGENPFGWQIYNFIIRWLGSVALWWSLRQIWPERSWAASWGGVIFLLYPGFGQQYVSINSSRHLFPLITFILSLGFTGRAYARNNRYWPSTGIAAALSLLTMLTTEYYYGLEFTRLFLLGILIQRSWDGKPITIPAILKAWIPYLAPLGVIFTWRFAISKQVNYEILLVDHFMRSPFQTVLEIAQVSLADTLEVSIGVLGKLFSFPHPTLFGPRKTMIYWGLCAVGAVGGYLYATSFNAGPQNRTWSRHSLIWGGLGLWISGLPFWVTGLDVKLSFPNDRLTLPFILGFSLVMVALIDLIRSRIVRNLLLAAFVGLALGRHFQNAVSYQRDWQLTRAFFEQLTWRVPGLAPGTAVVSPELPMRYSSDNSLTAPLNWIYGSGDGAATLPYGLFFLELRVGSMIPSLTPGTGIEMDYGLGKFSGSTSEMIVLLYEPPACLRVLDPTYDRYLPGTPEDLDAAMQFSDPSRLVGDVEAHASLPPQILEADSNPMAHWCFYFQKADLARQAGDWAQVAALGDVALKLDDSPNHASERVPFIEGYAHMDEWDTALKLTLEAIEINKFMGPMLCSTWERIVQDTPEGPARGKTIQTVEARLGCGLNTGNAD